MLDFLGIGAQKAASTWLFTHLRSHPDVSFPAGKEVHYWDRTPDPDGSQWQALFEAASTSKQGEITGAYALLAEKQVSLIHRIYPSLRVFYSIRNPIERSWAQVRMRYRNGYIAIDDVSSILQFCASPPCVQRNEYLQTIERWRGIFGRGQFHYLFYDDIVADPQAVLVRLAEHIGVDPKWFKDSTIGLSEKVFAGVEIPMPKDVRDYLFARYEEPIYALGRFLGRDFSSWLTSG